MAIKEIDVIFRSPAFEGEQLTICRRKNDSGFDLGVLHADGKVAVSVKMRV